MKYLGCISGRGALQIEGVWIADTTYELEGYVQRAGNVTGSGEIGLTSAVLQTLTGQPRLQLLISGDRLLNVKVTDKAILDGDHIHVDVSGDLPVEGAWRD